MKRSLLVVAVAGLVACSSGFGGGGAGGAGGAGTGGSKPQTADVAGDYTINATNGENGCNFDNWTKGQVTQGIDFTITQDGTNVTGTIGGLLGDYVFLVLGSDTFIGTVKGDAITMTDYGTNASTTLGCTTTVNATIHATIDGDAIQGTLDLIPKTNGSPDCGTLNNCASEVKISGARPPR